MKYIKNYTVEELEKIFKTSKDYYLFSSNELLEISSNIRCEINKDKYINDDIKKHLFKILGLRSPDEVSKELFDSKVNKLLKPIINVLNDENEYSDDTIRLCNFLCKYAEKLGFDVGTLKEDDETSLEELMKEFE